MGQSDSEVVTPGGPSLGYLVEPSHVQDLPAPPVAVGIRPGARIVARWDQVEREPGSYDWSAYSAAIEALARSGHRVVLCLTGPHPVHLPGGGWPSPLIADSLPAWLRFTRDAVNRFGDRVELFELWERVGSPGRREAPADYAFLLKSTVVAMRAEARARGSRIALAQGSLAAGGLDWQRSLWQDDVAAYIDVLPLSVRAGSETTALRSELAELLGESLRHPPAAEVWAYVEQVDGASPWDAPATAVTVLSAGVAVALVELVGPRAGEVASWTRQVHETLAGGGYAAAPTGQLELEDQAGRPLRGGRVLARFFSEDDFSTLIYYQAPGMAEEIPTDRLIVDTSLVRDATVIDPVGRREVRVSSSALAEGSRGRAVRVFRGDHPQALRFSQAAPPTGFDIPPEEVETERTRELTAEEIIARYQQVQKVQDDRLERFSARGKTELHFKLASGGSTIDVGIDSNYYWERGGELEWEQTDYWINGNHVTWKRIPQLPLIQAEKVVTVPLDLTLGKTYDYRLVGAGRVGDREAYVLAFEPLDPQATQSLYRGRVWIDRESFVRLRMSVIQPELEPPVISNEENQIYTPWIGPDGFEYWQLTTTDSQQVWKTGGRNFVVRRKLTFESMEINPDPADFGRRRSASYASSNQMLRDTREGFRYLKQEQDGSRTVQQEIDSSQIFAAVGATEDSSTDGVVPLGGIDYFNYNLFGKDIQVNALFAGVLGLFTASDPDLFGGNLDLTLDAFLIAIKTEDKLFESDDEVLTERIEQRNQNLSWQLGFPFGQFVKVNLTGGLRFLRYFDSDDAEEAVASYNLNNPSQSLQFVLPEDHEQLTGGVSAEFNRMGYAIQGRMARSRRSSWSDWGMFDTAAPGGPAFVSLDPATGLYVASTPQPSQDRFTQWSITAFKEWYLPKFQKLRAEVDYLDGEDLDRFSRYRFTQFGSDRLSGFAGSGVRFDHGLVARAGYSFNLFEAIRFDAVLENAWVENDGSGDGRQSFTGFGLGGNVVGPWTTVISLSYGYALSSDIEDLEGDHEFLLFVLKLF